jgi:nucleotide-binding universal stress UspA family protein
MHVLIAVKGREPEEYFTQLVTLLPPGALITLVHVIDERAHSEVIASRESYLFHRHLPKEREALLLEAEEQAAQRILAHAETALIKAGLTTLQAAKVTTRGKPEHEIVRLVEEAQIDLVAVCARRSGEVGPKSIGKVARFIIDHVRASALLVRPL